jgi:hypothetical protein
MVVVVGKGGVDISQRNTGIVVDDFVRGHVELFVPDHNVLNSNAMTSNAGLTAADAGGDLDLNCPRSGGLGGKHPRIRRVALDLLDTNYRKVVQESRAAKSQALLRFPCHRPGTEK